MLKGVHDERSENGKEKTHAKVCGENGGAGARSRARRRRPSVPPREHCASAVIAVEAEVRAERDLGLEGYQARPEASGKSDADRNETRDREAIAGAARNFDRTSGDEKKESLGLDGPLYGRHLTKIQRETLRAFIDESRETESVKTICGYLLMHPRSYYRWKRGALKTDHGGGGGKNKITPLEEKRVVAWVKKNPDWHCRRIAYSLEKKATVFIGKTKVAEIMKKHGLNHPFERKPPRPVIEAEDMLLHEPWRENLLWGMDWTWVTVDGKFMFLLVLLDWYSRKILSWGLHPQITKLQVVALVTDAVASERLDLLRKGSMKPIVVADHGSANASKYTKHNIEIQGLKLWLSGIGRPTGNARTERVIGTLKREEINLQEQYANETEAKNSIGTAIWDYNTNRPNQGNGGHSPNAVHHSGRAALMKRRTRARQKAAELRRTHWEQVPLPSGTSLT
jgi:putative transposase